MRSTIRVSQRTLLECSMHSSLDTLYANILDMVSTKLIFLFTGFIVYTFLVLIVVAVLIFRYVPRYGHTHMVVYVGICSLMGSLTVCFKILSLLM